MLSGKHFKRIDLTTELLGKKLFLPRTSSNASMISLFDMLTGELRSEIG